MAMGAMSFNSDGSQIAAQEFGNLQGKIHIWDVPQKNEVRQLSAEGLFVAAFSVDPKQFSINPMAFSSDGKILGIGTASSIVLWDTSSGKQLATLRTNLKSSAITEAMDPAFVEAMKKSGIKAGLWSMKNRQSESVVSESLSSMKIGM